MTALGSPLIGRSASVSAAASASPEAWILAFDILERTMTTMASARSPQATEMISFLLAAATLQYSVEVLMN